jgi:hypothetical protein
MSASRAARRTVNQALPAAFGIDDVDLTLTGISSARRQMASSMSEKMAHDLIQANIGIPAATLPLDHSMWLDQLSREWLPPPAAQLAKSRG